MEFEVGIHDNAYKKRLHSRVPFIGRKTLTVRQKTYYDIHGYVCKSRAQEYCNRTWDGRVTVSPRTGAGDSMDGCAIIPLRFAGPHLHTDPLH